MATNVQYVIIVAIFILFFYFLQNSSTRDSFSTKFITFLHHDLKESSRTGGGAQKKYDGYYQTGKRDTNLRLDLVSQKVDFIGKNILELGCNAGDFLLKLAPEIAFGVGIDFDSSRINEANFNARKDGFNNIIFYVDDLREGNEMEFINAFPTQKIDIVMMYAVCDRWLPLSDCRRIVKNSAKIADTLVIEVNRKKKEGGAMPIIPYLLAKISDTLGRKKKEGGGMPIIPYLSAVYNSVEEITDLDYCPDCRTRRLFVCKNNK